MSDSTSPLPVDPMKEDSGLGELDLSDPQSDSSGIINLIEPTIVFKVRTPPSSVWTLLEGFNDPI